MKELVSSHPEILDDPIREKLEKETENKSCEKINTKEGFQCFL